MPFNFGTNQDYHPKIDLFDEFNFGLDKEMYISTRGEAADKLLEELEEESLK